MDRRKDVLRSHLRLLLRQDDVDVSRASAPCNGHPTNSSSVGDGLWAPAVEVVHEIDTDGVNSLASDNVLVAGKKRPDRVLDARASNHTTADGEVLDCRYTTAVKEPVVRRRVATTVARCGVTIPAGLT